MKNKSTMNKTKQVNKTVIVKMKSTKQKTIKIDKMYKKCFNNMDGHRSKIFQTNGKRKKIKYTKIKFTKFTTTKFVIIMTLSLLLQTILPVGWMDKKTNKNSNKNNKKQNDKKNNKTQKSKNKMNEINKHFENPQNHGLNSIINLKILQMSNWAKTSKIRNKNMKMYNGNRKSSLNIMHWNLGSKYWDKKQNEIQALVDQYTPDILYISEANYFHDTPKHLVDIEGYKMETALTMENLKYSRIILLCREDLIYTVETHRMSNKFSSIWIKVGNRGKSSLRIGGAYREHYQIRQPEPNNSRDQTQQELRWKNFVGQWKAASSSGPTVVIGDLNLDLLKWDTPDQILENMVDTVKDDIMTRNIHQVIKGPTRFWNTQSPSLIDHCWSNYVENISNIKNFSRSTADHNVIGINYKLKGKLISSQEIKCRDRRNMSVEEFKRQLNIMNWDSIFKATNADIANDEFEQKFLGLLNTMAPMKKIQTRKRRSDWISKETKNLMIERDKSRDKAVASSQMEDWQQYRTERNMCNLLVDRDRKENLKRTYEELHRNNDHKGLYNLTKKKMGWKTGSTPTTFKINGKMVTSPKELADIQIKHFQNKTMKLASEIPEQTEDPLNCLKKAWSQWIKSDQVPYLKIKSVEVPQIIKLIKSMGKSFAFGHDEIDSKSLNISPEAIAAPIAHIINLSIKNRKFPSKWKLGRLIPIYKGGG